MSRDFGTVTKFRWVSASIEPSSIFEPIIYQTNNNKLGVFKNTCSMYNGDESTAHSNWYWLKNKYSIKYWTYQSELIL